MVKTIWGILVAASAYVGVLKGSRRCVVVRCGHHPTLQLTLRAGGTNSFVREPAQIPRAELAGYGGARTRVSTTACTVRRVDYGPLHGSVVTPLECP
jgi:hypothetical protein